MLYPHQSRVAIIFKNTTSDVAASSTVIFFVFISFIFLFSYFYFCTTYYKILNIILNWKGKGNNFDLHFYNNKKLSSDLRKQICRIVIQRELNEAFSNVQVREQLKSFK